MVKHFGGVSCHQTTVEDCKVLQQKQKDKTTNVVQLPIEDKQSYSNSSHNLDDYDNLSDDNSIYDKFMEIVDTEV